MIFWRRVLSLMCERSIASIQSLLALQSSGAAAFGIDPAPWDLFPSLFVGQILMGDYALRNLRRRSLYHFHFPRQ